MFSNHERDNRQGNPGEEPGAIVTSSLIPDCEIAAVIISADTVGCAIRIGIPADPLSTGRGNLCLLLVTYNPRES